VQKTLFFHFNYKYLAIYVTKVFEISTIHSYTSLVQDPMVRCENKKSIFIVFTLYDRNGNFEFYLAKKGRGPLGFNVCL